MDPSRPQASDSWNAANGIYCNYCGATPAVQVDFRAHRGLIFMMQFRKAPGPFCRDCGLATFRRMTGESLWQGWWGFLSFLINPFVLLINLLNRATVAQLPPPLPGAPYLPMPPGKPLYKRPEFAAIVIPIAAVATLISLAVTSPSSDSRPYAVAPTRTSSAFPTSASSPIPYIPPLTTVHIPPTTKGNATENAKAGDCLWNKHGPIADDKNPDVAIVPCGDPRAQAKILGRTIGDGKALCKVQYPNFDAYYTVTYTGYMSGLGYTLCLQTLK